MVHFIIINWFNWSSVWIWNIFIVKFNWKQLRVNLNTTMINGMMINYPYDSWNHRGGVGSRGPGFEVSWLRLAVPLYWWFIWSFTMKGFEVIHIYYNTWWDEFRGTDDAGIGLVSNPSTSFKNNLLSHVERYNKWLEIFFIIIDGGWRNKMMRAPTWSVQCCWSSNNI